MIIELAQGKDKQKIAKLDSHIPSPCLGECIWNGQVYVLKAAWVSSFSSMIFLCFSFIVPQNAWGE